MSDLLCKHCNEPQENQGKLMAHYKVCPLRPQKPANTANDRNAPHGGATPAGIIPLSQCPAEISVLGKGQTVGLRILGKLTDTGVLVEHVEFWR